MVDILICLIFLFMFVWDRFFVFQVGLEFLMFLFLFQECWGDSCVILMFYSLFDLNYFVRYIYIKILYYMFVQFLFFNYVITKLGNFLK